MNGLELEPPAPGGPAQDPAGEFALSEATAARIKAVAREYAGAFVAIETQSPEFDRMAARISTVGADEVRALSDQARLAMARSGSRESAVSAVHAQLARLRAVLERLNPGAGDDLLRPRKFLGLFPRGDVLSSYFDRYRDAEVEIETALSTMATSRDTLLQDNIAVTACRKTVWPMLARLAEAIGLCASLDERFERLAGQLDASDPAKAGRLRSTALFEVRQRHGDLLTQMAVSQQSYAMLGIVLTNNLELVKGIDRASATTIAALQTAIVAAQTLANQRIVLDRIGGVTAAATALSEGASGASARGNARVALDSAEASQQVAALRSAIADVTASVDALDSQQQSALGSL